MSLMLLGLSHSDSPGSFLQNLLCCLTASDPPSLTLSKQQSLGKFALVQDYVNYRQIITSLKRVEINYLFDEMVAEWENNDLTKINK